MKTYKQMAESALKRINEYEVKQKRKKKTIMQMSLAVGGICVVLLVATGIFKEKLFDKEIVTTGINTTTKTELNLTSDSKKTTVEPQSNTQKNSTENTAEEIIQTQETSKKGTTLKTQQPSQKGTTLKTQQPSQKGTRAPTTAMPENTTSVSLGIITADSSLKGSLDFAKPIKKGSVGVTQELKNAVKENGDNRTYAVMVSFEYSLPDDYLSKIKIDGISANELKKRADALLSEGKNTEAKSLYVKINEAKREYLLGYIDNFEDTFSKNGMDIYVEERGTTVENMIFYTYATGEQINKFICKPTEAFYFTLSAKFK